MNLTNSPSWGSMLMGVIMYFTGYDNLVLFFVLAAIRATFSSMSVVLMTMYTADCAEYGNFVSGERAQGVAFSIQTFTAKVTAALSGAVGMFILGAYGFVAGEGAMQSIETISGIWRMYTILPLITGVLAMLVLIIFYKLPQRDVAIMVRFNKGELSRQEAEAQLSKKY